MIFQLSNWFPKPMIWAIIIKFDQNYKEKLMVNFLCWNFGGQKNFFRGVLSQENVMRIAWKSTKTVILLGLAGYELIITSSAYGLVGYIYQLISGTSSKNNF